MRVLITGGGGVLGAELIRHAPEGVELHATRRTSPVPDGAQVHEVDLAHAATMAKFFGEVRPNLVIHTAVGDGYERDIWLATSHLVRGCHALEAALIYLSTDALLDGEHAPYGEDAEPEPVHEYGRWKAKAELHVRAQIPEAAVVRTSLLIRTDPPDRTSAWVVDRLRQGEPVQLFTDELRCPIAVEDLAAQIWELAQLSPEERGGVWHLVGPEAVTRYTLGVLLAVRHGLDPAGIVPARSAGGPPRPRDLRLLTTRADRQLQNRARPVSQVLLHPGA